MRSAQTKLSQSILGRSWCVNVLRECCLGGIAQGGEGSEIVHSQLSEDLAVNFDLSKPQALDETVVGQIILTSSSVDALDPQPTEVALLLAAVVVRVGVRVEHLLLGLAVQARTLTAVAGGALQEGPALLMGVDRPLHTCHVCTPNDLVPALTGT